MKYILRISSLLGFIFTVVFLGCDLFDDISTAGNTTQVGNAISLQGRVIDKSGYPVSGIIVKLANAGLADTTGSDGRYSMEGEMVQAALAKLSAANAADTLLFLRDDYQITLLEIMNLVDTLSDILIDRRAFSVTLEKVNISIGKIEAVLSGGGIPENRPIVTEFSLDTMLQIYGGIIYFPAMDANHNFKIHVNIYDDQGLFNNRSDTVRFNNLTDAITIPVNTGSALPVADAGADIMADKGEVFLHGSAKVGDGGNIVKWEWNINGAGFVETSSGDTAFALPSQNTGSFDCILRVTDDDGNTALDTAVVTVRQGEPEVHISIHSSFLVNDTAVFTADFTHMSGGVKSIKWDNGYSSGIGVSSGTKHIVSYPKAGSYNVKVTVEFGDGSVAQADTLIRILPKDSGKVEPIVPKQDTIEIDIAIRSRFIANEQVIFDIELAKYLEKININSIKWDNGMAPGIDQSGGSKHVAHYPMAGAYNVSVTFEFENGTVAHCDTAIQILPAETNPKNSISTLKKVLVTNFFFGYHYNVGRGLNLALIRQIAKQEDFEVDVVNSNDQFTPEKLIGVQLLILQNLTGNGKINAEMKTAVKNWVEKDGGDIFALGGTLDGSKGEWDWLYDNGIYGHYRPHSAKVPAQIIIDKEAYDGQGKLHPILEEIGKANGVQGMKIDMDAKTIDGWEAEWMNWNNYFRGAPNLTILLSMNTESYDCRCPLIENDHPALWITENIGGEGGGTISYFLAGRRGEIHGCTVNDYENGGKGCNILLKHLFRKIITYQGRK